MLRRVIEGSVKQAVSIANGADHSAFNATQIVEAEIPGVEERGALATSSSTRRWRPVRSIEDVCVSYGLVLTPADELPNFPLEYPYWKPKRGKLFTTTCPVCGEVLFVNTHYQRWTCLRCDRGFPDANDKLPTPSD